jgi:hypothetical protein
MTGMPTDTPYLLPYDGPTVDILITYNQLAHEDQALQLARRLFAELDLQIASLTLLPVEHADFTVWIDGHQVGSLQGTGCAPSSADCVACARERLAQRAAAAA